MNLNLHYSPQINKLCSFDRDQKSSFLGVQKLVQKFQAASASTNRFCSSSSLSSSCLLLLLESSSGSIFLVFLASSSFPTESACFDLSRRRRCAFFKNPVTSLNRWDSSWTPVLVWMLFSRCRLMTDARRMLSLIWAEPYPASRSHIYSVKRKLRITGCEWSGTK